MVERHGGGRPGEVRSARDAVEAAIARIGLANAHLHAVSALFADAARARAAALDTAAARGAPRGPLHGVPVLVKELVDIAGRPTAFGSLAYARGPAARNAPLIDRLEAAGAIILGTTHMVEFAIGGWGTNRARGAPRNPADPRVHRVAGGSSSGSAVAVAAGLVELAIGSDTGGSVRIPASLCGVVGFKPSFGLIPTDGVAPLCPGFDTIAPLAGTVALARRATEAMAGVSLGHAGIGLGGLVCAVLADAALAPIDSEALGAYRATLGLMARAGAHLREIALPLDLSGFQRLNGDIVAHDAYASLGRLAEDPSTPLDPFVRGRVLAGKAIDAGTRAARLAEIAAHRASFADAVAGADVLVLPGTPIPAPPLAEVDESAMPMSRYTRVVNCLGLCAVALPAGRTAGGLPLGIQLCAREGDDARLLAIAESLDTCRNAAVPRGAA